MIQAGTDETIVLTEAGTLAQKLSQLNTADISSLTLKGPINSNDIITLRSGEAPISNLSVLNMKYVTFEYSEEAYITIDVSTSSFGSPASTKSFYVSNFDSVKVGNTASMTGWTRVYTTNLEHAFSNMTSLKQVVLPDVINKIGEGCFRGCTNLTSVEFPESISAIDGNMYTRGPMEFSGKINDGAFSDCSSLTSFTIPESVESIGKVAFSGCGNLARVSIPENCMSIEKDAFEGTPFWDNLPYVEDIKYIGKVAMDYNGGGTKFQFREGTLAIANRFSLDNTDVTEVVFPTSLRIIGSYAFSKNDNLAEFTLPKGLDKIGEYAFEGCAGPKEVTISENVELGDCVFCNNSGLERVNYNSEKEYSAEYAHAVGFIHQWLNTGLFFSGCSSLKEVCIGPKVRCLPPGIFSGCQNLQEVIYAEREKDVTMQIYDEAFRRCSNLEKIEIPCFVDSISKGAFSGCEALSQVIVKDLAAWCRIGFEGESANPLYNCASLYYEDNDDAKIEDVVIPEGVERIKDYAFSGCDMASIELPNSVESIGSYTFSNSVLSSIIIPNSVTNIGRSAFSGCTELASITIPNSVAMIEIRTFENCVNLSSIIIPSSIAIIESEAFGGCTSLTSIKIPNTVKNVGTAVFRNCTNLSSVTFPNSETSIQDAEYLFDGCYGLKEIISPIKIPRGISGYVFAFTRVSSPLYDNTTLIVPIGSADKYNKSGWKGIKNIVEERIFLPEDVNGDDNINTADVVAVYSHIINGDESGITSYYADANIDGNVNTADVVAIYNAIINGVNSESNKYLHNNSLQD